MGRKKNNNNNNENNQDSDVFLNYGDLIAFYQVKSEELAQCRSKCRLKLQDKRYIKLRFIDPTTGKYIVKAVNNLISHKEVLDAFEKAQKVDQALRVFKTASEFWTWFKEEIEPQKPVNDLKTYRQIFQEIENEYFRGKHRNTGRKRIKDITQPGGASDLKTFNRQYTIFFNRIPDWDKYPD